MVMPLTIRVGVADDLPALNQLVKDGHHPIENQYFETAWAEQEQDKRLVFLAFVQGRLAGYVYLNFYPQYAPFARLKIPEIQDLYVHPDQRRQGIGAHLILACEAEAAHRQMADIAIGVGITREFGAAQRLYVKMGYVPDGAGIVFERTAIQSGELRPIDDRLCLMLVKPLTKP